MEETLDYLLCLSNHMDNLLKDENIQKHVHLKAQAEQVSDIINQMYQDAGAIDDE